MRVYERIAARNRMTGKEFSSAINGPPLLSLFVLIIVALVIV